MLRVGILWQYHVSIPCEGTHMTVPRVGASRARTLAVPCVLTPQLPPCAIPHLTPDTLSILSLLACHPLLTRLSSLSRRTFHPFVVSTPALSNLATFPLATCALKRFPLTSPRKLALTCVKRGFLRTAEPHRTLQISPCAPQVSQCHVYVMPGWDVPCPCAIAPSAPPARELLSCPVS